MPDHADWPLGVQEISIENLASLGVNDEGEIFWNGKRIEVRRRLLLTWWQKMAAAIVVIFAILGGAGGFVQGAGVVFDHYCAADPSGRWCPPIER
jgi:hypothetical protein